MLKAISKNTTYVWPTGHHNSCAHSFTPFMPFVNQFSAGMWVSRPGLSLETDQDHFFEVLVLVLTLLVLVLASLVLVSVLVSACLVLVLVLVSQGGLEQDLRLCATQRYLCRKSKLASECAPLFIYLLAFPHF